MCGYYMVRNAMAIVSRAGTADSQYKVAPSVSVLVRVLDARWPDPGVLVLSKRSESSRGLEGEGESGASTFQQSGQGLLESTLYRLQLASSRRANL